MKLEIARGLFLVGALAVTTAAMAAWDQPRPGVLTAAQQCPLPHTPKVHADAKPDHDLLLFMFGMTQGVRSRG
ncbi:hypothetical protein LZ023_09845 [Pseudomonas silvicola]|nr:hypothetical protein LZ023_09820 [Pseudomonas silvicola]WAH59811.1 hypothetical protein LZ023_09845 [Pseudomonas silvicola]